MQDETPDISPEQKRRARTAIMNGGGMQGAESALLGESYEAVNMDQVLSARERKKDTSKLVEVQNEGVGRFVSPGVSADAEFLAESPLGDDIERLLSGEVEDSAVEQLTSYTIEKMAQGGVDAVVCIRSLQSVGLGSVVSQIADDMVSIAVGKVDPPQAAPPPGPIKMRNTSLTE